MKTKLTVAVLAFAAASAMLGGCNQSATTKLADTPKPLNAASVPALPSLYSQPEYAEAVKAIDGSAAELLRTAKSTQDLEKVTPAIKEYMGKRDALLSSIKDGPTRQNAYREVTQKNFATAEDRMAYAKVMSAYYKANHPAPVGAAAPSPASAPRPAAK